MKEIMKTYPQQTVVVCILPGVHQLVHDDAGVDAAGAEADLLLVSRPPNTGTAPAPLQAMI